ncbi:phosphopantetheine-binding protein [Streptomyces sp. NPDC008092]|uniref:acyl carrier protein n=1 Tax=Streptomyces sp. NPDC008092 TaxID=3364808 RepID=UPI0036DFBD48
MPDTPIDTVLTAVSEVFGHPVTPEDDFFSLGGDSITAVELSIRLEERLDVDVDVELIVNVPHLAALAAALTQPAAALSTADH